MAMRRVLIMALALITSLSFLPITAAQTECTPLMQSLVQQAVVTDGYGYWNACCSGNQTSCYLTREAVVGGYGPCESDFSAGAGCCKTPVGTVCMIGGDTTISNSPCGWSQLGACTQTIVLGGVAMPFGSDNLTSVGMSPSSIMAHGILDSNLCCSDSSCGYVDVPESCTSEHVLGCATDGDNVVCVPSGEADNGSYAAVIVNNCTVKAAILAGPSLDIPSLVIPSIVVPSIVVPTYYFPSYSAEPVPTPLSIPIPTISVPSTGLPIGSIIGIGVGPPLGLVMACMLMRRRQRRLILRAANANGGNRLNGQRAESDPPAQTPATDHENIQQIPGYIVSGVLTYPPANMPTTDASELERKQREAFDAYSTPTAVPGIPDQNPRPTLPSGSNPPIRLTVSTPAPPSLPRPDQYVRMEQFAQWRAASQQPAMPLAGGSQAAETGESLPAYTVEASQP